MFSHARAFTIIAFSLLLLVGLSGCTMPGAAFKPGEPGGIPIVAAENFYGNIAQQIGGKFVTVTSFLSDPNVDPHQFESSVQNAIDVSSAAIVIENGSGYDSWMNRLLAAAPADNRVVLTATNIATHMLPDNPHVWYGIDNIEQIARALTTTLDRLDGRDASYYEQNLQKFIQSLHTVTQKMSDIKQKYAGTPIGLTETIFLYQTTAMGLNVLTPLAFQKAIAEGNDPPANTVVAAYNEVNQRQIKVLVYNKQTITPITTNMQNEAIAHHIPVVGVTETMPQGKTYQQWMLDQLDQLAQALQTT